MARKKQKYVCVDVDAETALELVLSLADFDTFLEAKPCGEDCLSMKFHGIDGPYERQIRGLPPALVKEFSEQPFFSGADPCAN